MAEDTTTSTTATTQDAPAVPAMDDSSLLGTAPKTDDALPADKVDAKVDDKPEDKPADKADDKAIEYQDFKLPEDFKLDDKMFSDFKEQSAKAGLTQDQAQSFIDMHVALAKQQQTNEEGAFQELQNAWKKEVTADKEIGGDKLPQTLASISKAIDQFGGKEAKSIREAFNFTGAGNNPQIVRFMAKLAGALSEGSPLPGNKPSHVNSKTAAETLYPSGAAGAGMGNQHL